MKKNALVIDFNLYLIKVNCKQNNENQAKWRLGDVIQIAILNV